MPYTPQDIENKYKEFLMIKDNVEGITVGCLLEEYQLMFDYASSLKGDVLEIGGGSGASTEIFAMALEGTDKTITQVDFLGKESFLLLTDKSKIIKHQMRTDEFFEKCDKSKKYSVIFIDADHSHEGADFDIRNAVELLDDKGVLLAHDVCASGSEHIEGICKAHASRVGRSYKTVSGTVGYGLGMIY